MFILCNITLQKAIKYVIISLNFSVFFKIFMHRQSCHVTIIKVLISSFPSLYFLSPFPLYNMGCRVVTPVQRERARS